MEFPNCKAKSVKADIANGDLTITFRMKINDDIMEAAEALGLYVGKDAGEVEVRVIPRQPPLKGLEPVTAEEVADEADDDE
jgi:hypothetical protein